MNLPESETSKDVQAVGIVLTLRQDGSTAIDGVEVAWESVTAALRERAEETGALEVIIRGDEAVSYGRAVAALDRVRLSGLESISLQTVRTGE